jgi:hypothetical protein
MAFFVGRNDFPNTQGAVETSERITYKQNGEVIRSIGVRKVVNSDGTSQTWVDHAEGIPGAERLTPPTSEAKWSKWLYDLANFP